jgi:hypothetical protein
MVLSSDFAATKNWLETAQIDQYSVQIHILALNSLLLANFAANKSVALVRQVHPYKMTISGIDMISGKLSLPRTKSCGGSFQASVL